MRYTASNLVKAISSLPRNQWLEYISVRTSTKVCLVDAVLPEGPITIRRYNPRNGQSFDSAENESISTQMIWRVANAIQPDMPFNFDRILGASYNTRSALETLLAHTPEFYWCKPGRIELINSSSEIKEGHKHLIWKPSMPHENGKLFMYNVDQVISEIPSASAVYESLSFPQINNSSNDIEGIRRHLQIQVALVEIGCRLGFRTWIAHNDKGLSYGDKKVGELDGVIARLENENLLLAYSKAIDAARHIDCIWFRNGRFMPAVMEVEHTTGVTSGLTRMKNLQEQIPAYPTRWVIVAPDELRDKVLREANKPQFESLKAVYFPYSAVDELFALCQKRRISNRAVNEEFLDCYMESCIQSLQTYS